MSRQDVIFVVLDSLRRDKLSVYNDEVDFTENIRAFSEEATLFENAVSNSSWTFPSHASIFTGMYPWEHHGTQQNLSLDVEKELLVQKFKDEDYRSAAFSTNAWLSDKFGLMEGFDTVNNMSNTGFSQKLSKLRRMMDGWLAKSGNEHLKRFIVRLGNYLFHYRSGGSKTEEVLSKAEEFIGSDDERSYFLFMNLMDAHEPYFPPEKYRDKHDAPEPDDICQDPTDYHFGRKEPDFDGIDRIYDASVDHMDDMLGEFFGFLKRNDEWEDTLIVLISDHGQMLGENGDYGHQFSVSDQLVHVPMIVKGLGKDTLEQQVELKEIYDIITDVADIEESYEPGSKFALGGYDFPDMMRPRIPPKRWKEFYLRHKFVRTENGKLILSETEDEEKSEKFEFGEGLTEEEKQKLRDKLDSIEYSDERGEQLENKDEEILKKLEGLGYG